MLKMKPTVAEHPSSCKKTNLVQVLVEDNNRSTAVIETSELVHFNNSDWEIKMEQTFFLMCGETAANS